MRVQINWWLYDMERRHSTMMTVFEVGRSWEDRSMLAVKVRSGLLGGSHFALFSGHTRTDAVTTG